MLKAKILIIKTGTALTEALALYGDFDAWFARALGPERFEYQTIAVDRGEALPTPGDGFDGVLITGSAAMVSHRLDWAEATLPWLREVHARGCPMLGVCFGHQLLAHAFGGMVGPNPKGRGIGAAWVDIHSSEDFLLGHLHPGHWFHITHLEAVLQVPSAAVVIAGAGHDPHHALYFGQQTWGVQFHPEFDRAMMQTYIEARASVLSQEGLNPAGLIEQLHSNESGHSVLDRFGLCVERHRTLTAA